MIVIELIISGLIYSLIGCDVRGSRDPRSRHHAPPTPPIEVPTYEFPVPVHMRTSQPAIHETGCPTPKTVEYITGWPTSVWTYPVPQPPWQAPAAVPTTITTSASPSVEVSTVHSAIPFASPVPSGGRPTVGPATISAPTRETFAPSTLSPSRNEELSKAPLHIDTLKPNSAAGEPPMAPFRANTSFPSVPPSKVPLPPDASLTPSSADPLPRPPINYSNHTSPPINAAARSSVPSTATPSYNFTPIFTATTGSPSFPMVSPAADSTPPNTASTTQPTSPAPTPIRSSQPLVQPLPAPSWQSTAPNKAQPSVVSYLPSSCRRSCQPTILQASYAPQSTPIVMPSVSSEPIIAPQCMPSNSNGAKVPTLHPTSASSVLSTTNSQRSFSPSVPAPSHVGSSSIKPTVHATVVPSRGVSSQSRSPSTTVSSAQPMVHLSVRPIASHTPSCVVTTTPSARISAVDSGTALPTRVMPTPVPSVIIERSRAPSTEKPEQSQQPLHSVAPTTLIPSFPKTSIPSAENVASIAPSTTATGTLLPDTRAPTNSASTVPTSLPTCSSTTLREPSATPTILTSTVATARPTSLNFSPVPTSLRVASSRLPTVAAIGLAPVTVPSLQPTIIATSTGPTTCKPITPVTSSPTRSPFSSFILVNTTASAVLANSTTTGVALSQSETNCIRFGVMNSLATLHYIVYNVLVSAQRQQLVSSYASAAAVSWNLEVIITLNTTQNSTTNDIASLQYALNMSLYSGLLQENIRAAALVASPPITSMLMVVVCSETNQARCRAAPIPSVPTASDTTRTCKQESTDWNVLYKAPIYLPWYMFWTVALLAAWIIVAVWVVSILKYGYTAYVLTALCAFMRVAYFALLLAQYFISYSSSTTRVSMACIEFAFLGIENREQFYLTWTVILARSLFYPLLLLLANQLVRDYWTCRHTRDQLYVAIFMVVALCLVALSAFYIVLLSAHAEQAGHSVSYSTAAAVVGAGLIAHLLCGTLLLVQGARLWAGRQTLTRARGLSDVYGDPHPTGLSTQRSNQKHHSIEAKSPGRDLEYSGVRPAGMSTIIEAESAFERSAAAHMATVISLLMVNGVLVIVTAIPQALATPIAAFVLYSILARVSEILLVVVILWKCISLRAFLCAQDEHADLPVLSVQSSHGDMDMTSGSKAAKGTFHLPSQDLSNFHSLGLERGADANKQTKTEVLSRLSDLTEQSYVDRTVWNKKWPWVVTPSEDIAIQVAEQIHGDNSLVQQSQPLQAVPEDSGSEDSTDSSGTYFV